MGVAAFRRIGRVSLKAFTPLDIGGLLFHVLGRELWENKN